MVVLFVLLASVSCWTPRGTVGTIQICSTMAMGRPVVAVVPDLCETANTVREGRFGYVVAPDHSQELASAPMSLKNDNQLCVAMGRRSREMFERRFDKPIGTARYVQLVEEAIRD